MQNGIYVPRKGLPVLLPSAAAAPVVAEGGGAAIAVVGKNAARARSRSNVAAACRWCGGGRGGRAVFVPWLGPRRALVAAVVGGVGKWNNERGA